MSTDWNEWHAEYDDPDSSLSRRRRSVQVQVDDWLDRRPGEQLRIVSACSGDGRDVLEVLARRLDADRVEVLLIETDPILARAAKEFARHHDLGRVVVRRDDAGTTDAYVDGVPADLVMMCGVFGNLTDEDLRLTIGTLPQFCAVGATVLWTRGRFSTGDLTPTIRGWFTDCGFEEVSFDAPEDATYRVGANRLTEQPRPLVRGTTFFTFTR